MCITIYPLVIDISDCGKYLSRMAIKNYPGSKAANGAWQQIISQIPQCEIFIESMAGSGFISRKLSTLSIHVITNDIDRSVIEQFDCDACKRENLDYRYLIDKYDTARGNTVFYFDPPYLMETRKSKKALYKFEWNDAQHEQFLTRAVTVKSNCMISHYPCELYDNALQNWRKIDYNSMTRKGARIERLYMNFPPPALLLQHKSVGKNYIDRQRIKRKVDRLIARLHQEDPAELSAILTAITDKFKYISKH